MFHNTLMPRWLPLIQNFSARNRKIRLQNKGIKESRGNCYICKVCIENSEKSYEAIVSIMYNFIGYFIYGYNADSLTDKGESLEMQLHLRCLSNDVFLSTRTMKVVEPNPPFYVHKWNVNS